MKYILKIFLLFSVSANWSCQQKTNTYQPQNGDILFQDLDCGPLCDAIKQVTASYGNYHFSHLGLVYKDSMDSVCVIEAIGTEVQCTPLRTFLNRSLNTQKKPKVIAMRTDFSLTQIDSSVIIALSQLSKPYDDYFLPNNDKWYCSELIAYAFNTAMHETIFEQTPMTYKTAGSPDIMPVWIEYFKNLNMAVPEGIPGCNPGGMSRSNHLKLVFVYY